MYIWSWRKGNKTRGILGVSLLINGPDERVTGRKARGLQMEEIGCKCQTFFISLISSRRKQTTSVRFFSPSLYKFKRGFLLKFYVAMTTPGST